MALIVAEIGGPTTPVAVPGTLVLAQTTSRVRLTAQEAVLVTFGNGGTTALYPPGNWGSVVPRGATLTIAAP